jgi:tetratricopeptide (TPR) repeat protein
MQKPRTWAGAACFLGFLLVAFWVSPQLPAQTNDPDVGLSTNTFLTMIQGNVQFAPKGSDVWTPARLNQPLHPGDRVRTDERSRAQVHLSAGMTKELAERSSLLIPPAEEPSLLRGLFKIFNRERGRKSEFTMPGASGAVRGTDVLVRVSEDGRSEVTVIDGEVLLRNDAGEIVLTNNQRGVAERGVAPYKTAIVETMNDLIQWSLYYPAVLDPEDLGFSTEDQEILADSLNAYRSGDLLQALEKFPWQSPPTSDAVRVYSAALLLSVGQVVKARELLETIPVSSASQALNKLIAAVKFEALVWTNPPSSASEWLATSYYWQSRSELVQALKAAQAATTNTPNFGFAWARVAELEFSFGRTAKALAALERALQISPRNAQALALKGFLLAAQNKIRAAIAQFDEAIATDSALANAWLGRGLCLIRVGHSEEGLRDLLVAASLESQRSLLRSYLGKAFADAGDERHANHELALARQLDPNDPTSWLYSALLRQQQNRINEAIADLEASQERNTNRSLFRSRFLLDQDRAVGSENLASIYRDAGMTDVSVREAARAVTYEYANASAHLFLSDSYNELRDPTQFNLRYETVWFNELLLANLLSPVGGGRLSQHVSQQEYSRLFEADGLGLANSTRVRTDGMFVELASQFGTFGGTSYSLDLDYRHNDGVRPNNELDSIQWYTTVKQQITPQDTALLLVKYEDYHSGDNFQYYDPLNLTNGFRPDFRFDEYQHPIVVGGWHHEWSPGIDTLLLGGRLENEQFFSDKSTDQLVLIPTDPYDYLSVPFDAQYHGQLEIYTAEVNQIFQMHCLSLSAGARYQSGTFDTTAQLYNPASSATEFDGRATNAITTSEGFERITGYGYLTLEPIEGLWLLGGLAYDDLTYPRNFRHPPISSGEDHRSQLGPKAGLVWSPVSQATLRGVFSRSLGGVSLDESFRLEPTQLAGFPQAFRSLISESVVGSVSAPEYQTFGVALDLKFPSGTYAGIQAERLETEVRRDVGVFMPIAVDPGSGLFQTPFIPSSTPEDLDFHENSIRVSLNQLVGHEIVLGANYKFTQAELHDALPDVPVSALPTAELTMRSDLHEASGYILFNHSSGFFARAESHWYHQRNTGDPNAGPGDDFFQHNLFAGYRFCHRRAEILLGILNLTGEDYHLSPLTVYAELPRERVFEARLNFQF